MQDRRRHVIAIADASFGRVGWNHAMPGIVKQQSCQQVVGFVAYDGAVGPLGKGFLPDRLKQRAIHDRRLLARQDLVPVFDLADIEVVAQHVVQRTTAERYSAARRARRELLGPCSDVSFFEVPYQFVNAAEFQLSPEDQSDQLSFFFDDRDLALFHLVAKRQSASDPKALSL